MTPETPPLASREDVVARLPELRAVAEMAMPIRTDCWWSAYALRADCGIDPSDAGFIATFDPPTVLSLLSIIEEDGKMLEDLTHELAIGNGRAESENARLREQVGRLRLGLEKIERWFGEFPKTGQTRPDGTPMSYAAAFGSNGERDFMRNIAYVALTTTAPDKQEDKGNGE